MNEKATFIRDLDGFTGEAKLYKLDPPMEETDFDNEVVGRHKYVVVSATVAMFTGPETYIFPSDENGNVTSWGELEGSYRGGLDHETALKNAGYSI